MDPKISPIDLLMSAIEREQYIEYEGILMDEMTENQLRRAGERWELICEQRGWAPCRLKNDDSRSPFLPAPPCVLG